MKKIGILSFKLGENSFGVTLPYLEFIRRFGTPCIIDFSEPVRNDLDLLILPGGPDVDPRRYGAQPNLRTGKPCIFREYFDEHILPDYIAQGTPIFGICRGLQALVVGFGGKLHQHIGQEWSIKSRDELVHKVEFKIKENNIIKVYTEEVNSLHHQSAAEVGEHLKVIAKHKKLDHKGIDLGTVEAIMHRTLPIAAVQYHPEELVSDILSDAIILDMLYEDFNSDNYIEL